MMSKILKFVDSSKTRKSEHLENETLVFLQIKKKHLLHTKGCNMTKKIPFSKERPSSLGR